MFICEHIAESNRRFCSFEDEELFLRAFSSDRMLVCPDCKERVHFRAGTKRPHFYHQRQCKNPNPFHEPETEVHRLGKFVIYHWLKKTYPEYRVELEYYIPETKQRSDIMLIHTNGQRWAFEFQCSRIPGSAWLERHQLYQEADVIDFWILSDEILRFEEGKSKLIGLENSIHKSTSRIQYLNPISQIVSFLLDGSLHGELLFKPATFESSLGDVLIQDSSLWIKEFEEYERQKKAEEQELNKEKEHLAREVERHQLEEEKRVEALKRRAEQMEEQRKQSLNDNYIQIMQDRHDFQSRFTGAEKKLFKSLCLKHQFNEDNFPGILHLRLLHSDLIITPPQLWQLWVFDEIYEQYAYCLKNNKAPRIWLDRTKDRFKNLRKKGILRTKAYPDESVNYIFTMYDYIDKLNESMVLQKIGFSTSKYQEIRVNQLPLFCTHKDNVLLNMAYSGFTHDNLKEIIFKYITKLRIIREECSKQQVTTISIIQDQPNLKSPHNMISKLPKLDVSPSIHPTYEESVSKEHSVPLDRLEFYREIFIRCKNSERLNLYPVLLSHIQCVEAIFSSYDKTKIISWNDWCHIYVNIENLKTPLLGK